MSQSLGNAPKDAVGPGRTGCGHEAHGADKFTDDLVAATVSMIKYRIVVMSGKGGVGKSTVAVNLAASLAALGKQIGVLDADVHGPDIPMMFGLQGQIPESATGYLLPLIAPGNIRVMSMGFLISDRDRPVAWRGPLKHRLFQQFLSEVEWGPLDYLVIDLPPGTGDEPLSIAQLLGKPLWAVIVTTPQDVALLDSRKAAVFGREMDMDVLGIVENMSGLTCPYCGGKIDLFKVGGGEQAARELGVPFLGRIPIDPEVVGAGDEGLPMVLRKPDSRVAHAFKKVAGSIMEALGNRE
ncbi:MAG: Mrp/NBP35 family ATP-binding protein [Desulfomonilaceae bacterium]|nr:Mrp/NBP35 family ATP-binding protein [Desulfomonilaceae bacterium]